MSIYSHADYIVTIDGIAFDSEARTVAETDTQRYVGYCDAEVVGMVALQMTRDAGFDVEWGSVDYALSVAGLACSCDTDEEDDDA